MAKELRKKRENYEEKEVSLDVGQRWSLGEKGNYMVIIEIGLFLRVEERKNESRPISIKSFIWCGK